MTSLFLTHKILKVVDGSEVRPAAAGDQQDLWDQNNNEALTSLYMCMTDEEVESVSSCKTAAEIWTKLNSIHESITGASKQVLWQKYFSIMALPGQSPVKVMVEIQNYAAQLRSMGAPIDDEMEVARIISSLMDEKYRQLREAWRSVDVSKQTTTLLLSRLKSWELEENQTEKFQEESSKAYAARKSKLTKEELANLKTKSNCRACNLQGHWKNDPICPANKDKKSESSGAYAAGPLSNLWIADSGASNHFCGDLQWFTKYEKYEVPKPVAMANNSKMLVEGVGQVKVSALINKC